VPANGYLENRGASWGCERGFRKQESRCIELLLPARAHLDYSGNDWQCDDGFNKSGGACLPET
jgi:hypothetical protein